MREFLAGWIVFQLIFIGLAGTDLKNKMVRGEYECKEGVVSPLFGAVVPLVFFAQDITKEYCEAL